MTTKAEYWKTHIAAIEQMGCSTSGYAKRHGLALATLYHWQRTLRLAADDTPFAHSPSKFVALTLMPTQSAQPVPCQLACTLVLAAGIKLEFPALPDPAWLLALSQATRGAR
jgi:transposase-like protein